MEFGRDHLHSVNPFAASHEVDCVDIRHFPRIMTRSDYERSRQEDISFIRMSGIR